MYKILNLFFVIIIIIFFFNIFIFYSSNKNIENMNLNRSNIDEILKKKIKDITILKNDTNNIIEHNSNFNEEIKDNEQRSFWNLIKPE